MATIEQARKVALDQYSEAQVADGEAFAEAQGYADADEWFSLVMSKILYSADQLEAGGRFAVEPGSLDEYFA